MFNILEEAQDIRHDLHMYPELGFNEINTSNYIVSYLNELGIQNERIAKTGVIAVIPGSGKSKSVLAIRADMDALEVKENTNLLFKSKTEGVMHACGHDGHMAILLCLAKYIIKNKYVPEGTVKLFFQPAEEIGTGAKKLVEEGCLRNPDVNAIVGYHLWPELECGTVKINDGIQMAGSDKFQISITGKGGHGAYPTKANNPINGAAEICSVFTSIPGRICNVSDYATISIGRVYSGTSFNIIPESAIIEGSIRTVSSEIREKVMEEIKKSTENISKAYGLVSEVAFEQIAPMLVNNKSLTWLLKKAVKNARQEVSEDEKPAMVSEDFAYYLERVPGAYMFIGAKQGESIFLHNCKFNFSELAMQNAVIALHKIINCYFNHENKLKMEVDYYAK